MALARGDHENILRQTLQICEIQLAQQFHSDLISLRKRVQRENQLAFEKQRSEAIHALKQLILPPQPNVSSAENEWNSLVHEHTQLENKSHGLLVTYMEEKNRLTEEYEQLYQVSMERTQQRNQSELQQMIQQHSQSQGCIEEHKSNVTSASTSQKHLSTHTSASGSRTFFVREENGGDSGATSPSPARSRPQTAKVDSSSAISESQRTDRSHHQQQQITPGRIRPQTAKSRKSKSPASTMITRNPTLTVTVDAEPLSPTTNSKYSGLKFDSGVDALIASLNETFSSLHTEYRILPERVLGDPRTVQARDMGRTRYSRKIARTGGRTMSKVTRVMLARAELEEQVFREKRRKEEEDRLKEAILMSPKGSPIIQKLERELEVSRGAAGNGSGKKKKRYSSDKPFKEQLLAPELSESRIQIDSNQSQEAKESALEHQRKVDYLALSSSEARLKDKLDEQKQLELQEQLRNDQLWRKERKRARSGSKERIGTRKDNLNGKQIDSVELFMNSSSTLSDLKEMRMDRLVSSTTSTIQPLHRRSRTSQGGSVGHSAQSPPEKSHSRERSRSRSRSHSRDGPRPALSIQSQIDPEAAEGVLGALHVSAMQLGKKEHHRRAYTATSVGLSSNHLHSDDHTTIPDVRSPSAEDDASMRDATRSPVPMLPLPKQLQAGDTTGTANMQAAGGMSFRSDDSSTGGFITSRSHTTRTVSQTNTGRSFGSHDGDDDVDTPIDTSRSGQSSSSQTTSRIASARLGVPGMGVSQSQPALGSRESSARGPPGLKHRASRLSLQMEEPTGEQEIEAAEANRLEYQQQQLQQQVSARSLEGAIAGSNLPLHSTPPRSQSTSALSSPMAPPETDRSSSFKSRPSTGLRLSFSIPTAVGMAADGANGQQEEPQVLSVWPSEQPSHDLRQQPSSSRRSSRQPATPAHADVDSDSSSGLSSDSDSDTHSDEKDDGSVATGSPSRRLAEPLSPPLSPPVVIGAGDVFGAMLDSIPVRRASDGAASANPTATSAVEQPVDEGPSPLAVTVSSLRSRLGGLRHECSDLREMRDSLQRELDSVKEQRGLVDDLAWKERVKLQRQAVGLGEEGSGDTVNDSSYHSTDHSMNLLHLRQLLYSATKEQRDLEYLYANLTDEVDQLTQRLDIECPNLERLYDQTHSRRMEHARKTQTDQHRLVSLLRDGIFDVPNEILNGLRTLTRFWSQLHGFERDSVNQPPVLGPRCSQCTAWLVPSADDVSLRAKLARKRRKVILQDVKKLSEGTKAIIPTLQQRPFSAMPGLTKTPSKRPPGPHTLSSSSLASSTSTTSSLAVHRSSVIKAQKTEWDMLEELGTLAQEMKLTGKGSGSKTGKKSTSTSARPDTIVGFASTSHDRSRLIRERSEEKFSSGSILRPQSATRNQTDSGTNITNTNQRHMFSPNSPNVHQPSNSSVSHTSLGPDGVTIALRLRDQLLAREVLDSCGVFVSVSSGQIICRDCRYKLESTWTGSNGAVGSVEHVTDEFLSAGPLSTPDQLTQTFFTRRQTFPLKDVVPVDLLTMSHIDSTVNRPISTSTSGIQPRPFSAMNVRDLIGRSSRPISAMIGTMSTASLPIAAESSTPWRSHVIGARPLDESTPATGTLTLVQRLRNVLGFHAPRVPIENKAAKVMRDKYLSDAALSDDPIQQHLAPSPMVRSGHVAERIR